MIMFMKDFFMKYKTNKRNVTKYLFLPIIFIFFFSVNNSFSFKLYECDFSEIKDSFNILLKDYYFQSYDRISLVYPKLSDDAFIINLFKEYNNLFNVFLKKNKYTSFIEKFDINIDKIRYIYLRKSDWNYSFKNNIPFGNIIKCNDSNTIIMPWPEKKISRDLNSFLEIIKWEKLSEKENKILVKLLNQESHRGYFSILNGIKESSLQRFCIYSSCGFVRSLEFFFKLPNTIKRPYWFEIFLSACLTESYKHTFIESNLRLWISLSKIFYKYSGIHKSTSFSKIKKFQKDIYLQAIFYNDIEKNSLFQKKLLPVQGVTFIFDFLNRLSADKSFSSKKLFNMFKEAGYITSLEL